MELVSVQLGSLGVVVPVTGFFNDCKYPPLILHINCGDNFLLFKFSNFDISSFRPSAFLNFFSRATGCLLSSLFKFLISSLSLAFRFFQGNCPCFRGLLCSAVKTSSVFLSVARTCHVIFH